MPLLSEYLILYSEVALSHGLKLTRFNLADLECALLEYTRH